MSPESQLILAGAGSLFAGLAMGWSASAFVKSGGKRRNRDASIGIEPADSANAAVEQVPIPVEQLRAGATHTVSGMAVFPRQRPGVGLKTLPARSLHEVLETKQRLESELSAAANIIERQAAQLRAAEREARIDVLTQLPNRRAFDEQIHEVESLFQRHGVAYSLLMFDLDRFKAFNDTYGHAAGDSVLKMVGKILRTQRRPTDRAYRYGGEEFVMVCQATDARGAQIVAERVRRRMEASIVCVDGKELKVTASAGIAQIRAGISTRGLLDEADMALYIAKQEGRNRTYAPQVDDEAIMQLEVGALV